MLKDVAIQAKQLSKCYHIYRKPVDRIKQIFWRGKRRFFEEFWALKNVNIEIEKGETVGIVGANGSGKSTILQLVSGILTPTTGTLAVRGRVTALLELGAGFNPEFSGRDNVFMNAAIMGLSRRQTEARLNDILEFADIGGFIDKPVKTYSSGMYVRLAFSTMVNVSPEILLVDEALSVGDIRFQQKCMARIKDFCRSGTVLFVTHDTAAVTELCTRALWVESGEIRLDGKPKHVVDRYLQFMHEGTPAGEGASRKNLPASAGDASEWRGFVPVTEGAGQFGDYRVTIDAVRLNCEEHGGAIAYSGSTFEIGMIVHAHQTIKNPLFGFILKDRLGREIIGDNTALMRRSLPPLLENNRYAVFFRVSQWPNLFEGEYTLALAVAEGRLENYEICHWYHDVAVVKSIPLQKPAGIFSIPDMMVELVPVGKG